MARSVKPLTAMQVKNAKPKDKPYKLFDGGGLYLLVSPAGGKHWKLKYRQANGREGLLSFGAYPAVSLEQARCLRDAARSQKAQGQDPGQLKKQERAERERRARDNFRRIAEQWLELHATKVKPHTLDRYRRVLEKHVLPHLGECSIAGITPQDFLAVFQRIEAKGYIATSHIALNICNSISSYAIASGVLTINVLPSIGLLLPCYKVKHLAANTDPAFVGTYLHKLDTLKGKLTPVIWYGLYLLPYIFVRVGELTNARWADIDWEAQEWRYTVSKTNTPHIVPLAPIVIRLLRELHEYTGVGVYLFAHRRDPERHMANGSLDSALHRIGFAREQITLHGFRAIARTLLDEVLSERYDLIEQQLAHRMRDPNGRAYNRTTHLPERKRMMERWACYLDGLREEASQRVVGHTDTA